MNSSYETAVNRANWETMADSPAHSAEASTEYALTVDGARIALKHRARPKGSPVVLIHGLAVNADLWDLPDVRGDDFEYRSLATVLYEAGHDIWLMNVRGIGGPERLSEPPPGQCDWCIDHFILYDLPATIDHVITRTGRRPFVVGSSMGAMSLSGYLQGARLAEAGDAQRIFPDAGLSRRRQERLAGCVFVQFPAALRWPHSIYDDSGQIKWKALISKWRWDEADANYPFELLSRLGWLQALVEATGSVNLHWVRSNRNSDKGRATLPKPFADVWRKTERGLTTAMTKLYNKYKGTTHSRPEMFLSGGIRDAVDHLKAGVLRQLGKSVRAGGFVSALGEPDHVYSDHYDLVTAPTLLVLGGKDRIANADVTREAFFEKITSNDKMLQFYEEIAHGEFEAAPIAFEKVYPEIRSWFGARDKEACPA